MNNRAIMALKSSCLKYRYAAIGQLKDCIGLLIVFVTCIASGHTVKAQTGYIGEIRMFAGTFAPKGWALCAGQTMPINQNQVLYAILGTSYGGDGTLNFKLPDLRGRFPMGTGMGDNGLSSTAGEVGGKEQIILTTSEMPAHNHLINVSTEIGNTDNPAGATLAVAETPDLYKIKGYSSTAATIALSTQSVGVTGGNQPVDITPRFLGIQFIICLSGIAPPRP